MILKKTFPKNMPMITQKGIFHCYVKWEILVNRLILSDLMTCGDVDHTVEIFYNKVYLCLDKAIPKYHVKDSPPKAKLPSWYSIDLIHKITEKIVYIGL